MPGAATPHAVRMPDAATPGGSPRVVPFGDSALLAILGEAVDERVNRLAHALAGAVDAQRSAGASPWGESVPGYASVLVRFDPRRVTSEAATALLAELTGEVMRSKTPQDPDLPLVEIPVRYGGTDGPDLPTVAERTRLSAASVVELHAAVTYRVFLLGFAPGFAYLGTLPEPLVLPRRSEPRTRVPAGSVAIAGRQTAIYPFETPGGWHLLGRTDLRLWDVARRPPATLQPGRHVRFVPARG